MLPKIQPALSDYYSDNAAPLSTRIFESIWDKLLPSEITNEKKTTPKILDLGQAQPDSFNFYSEHDCFLTIADCIQSLVDLSWPQGDAPNLESAKKIKEILSIASSQYDIILVWDSFNYIQPEILPFVHNHLLKLCTPKTVIHGFLFTSENQPKESGRFKILSSGKIHHCVSTNEIVQHIPLTPIMLNKAMPGFKYSRSVLMRNGLQEFMLTRK